MMPCIFCDGHGPFSRTSTCSGGTSRHQPEPSTAFRPNGLTPHDRDGTPISSLCRSPHASQVQTVANEEVLSEFSATSSVPSLQSGQRRLEPTLTLDASGSVGDMLHPVRADAPC